MPQTALSESEDSTKSTTPSLSAELDKLTTAVLDVSDNIQACAQESDARHAACLARAEDQKQRTTSFQDQIAKMLAMTQEGLRKEREEPLKGMDFPFCGCVPDDPCWRTVSLPPLATYGMAWAFR